jgi:ABC-2 type transport system permease protein
MKGFYAMYRKEMGHYFVSPVAYVVVGVFLALSAFFFEAILTEVIQRSFEMQMEGMASGIDVPGEVTRGFLGLLSSLILFMAPMLTMGAYAEERKRGTMELLMTSPITEIEIVLGKFLASFTLFAIMLLPTAGSVIFLHLHSDPMPSWRIMISGYAGLLLLGGSLLALGTFISSLTENQLIAFAGSFGASLMLWVIDLSVREADSTLGQVVQYLSVLRHSENFTQGILDTSNLIYYASFIFLFVFLTVRSVDSMRWRRA